MLIGVGFGRAQNLRRARRPPGLASEMWHVTTRNVGGLGSALTSSKTRGEVSSIVGSPRRSRKVQAGASYALVFLGFISLVLAVINLFPFLPLDGGHILWAVAEKVRGRRISLAAMYRFSSVGIIVLLFLVINGISNDIGRLTADATQLLTSPEALRAGGAEQRLQLARRSSEISSHSPATPSRQ